MDSSGSGSGKEGFLVKLEVVVECCPLGFPESGELVDELLGVF